MIEGFCDGSCPKAGGPGGWAYVIIGDDGNNIYGSGWGTRETNNTMELLAGLECMRELHMRGLHREPCTIFSDSRYLVDGMMKWNVRWQAAKWQGVKNPDIWQQLVAMQSRFRLLHFEWLKGHNGNFWNEYVDRMAAKARASAPV